MGLFSGITDAIGGVFDSAADAVGDVLGGAADLVGDVVDTAGDLVGDVGEAFVDFATSPVGQVASFFIPGGTLLSQAMTVAQVGSTVYNLANAPSAPTFQTVAPAATAAARAAIQSGSFLGDSGTSTAVDKIAAASNILSKYPGANDVRVLESYMRVKNSESPNIMSTVDLVYPNIGRRKGQTIGLETAEIATV